LGRSTLAPNSKLGHDVSTINSKLDLDESTLNFKVAQDESMLNFSWAETYPRPTTLGFSACNAEPNPYWISAKKLNSNTLGFNVFNV
jgi:hypothetical protein